MSEPTPTRELLEAECLRAEQKDREEAITIAIGTLGITSIPFIDNISAFMANAPQPTGNPWVDILVLFYGGALSLYIACRTERTAIDTRAERILAAEKLGITIFPDCPNRERLLRHARYIHGEGHDI
jgi:hypothetical protein